MKLLRGKDLRAGSSHVAVLCHEFAVSRMFGQVYSLGMWSVWKQCVQYTSCLNDDDNRNLMRRNNLNNVPEASLRKFLPNDGR